MAFQSPITIHRAIRRIGSREYVLPVSGGSGVDLLLIRLREVIKEHGNNGFPVNKIEEEMSRPGKNLTFSQEELQDLAKSKNYEFASLQLCTHSWTFRVIGSTLIISFQKAVSHGSN